MKTLVNNAAMLATLLLIVLKVSGVITASWWLVFLPILFPLGLICGLLIFMVILILVGEK